MYRDGYWLLLLLEHLQHPHQHSKVLYFHSVCCSNCASFGLVDSGSCCSGCCRVRIGCRYCSVVVDDLDGPLLNHSMRASRFWEWIPWNGRGVHHTGHRCVDKTGWSFISKVVSLRDKICQIDPHPNHHGICILKLIDLDSLVYLHESFKRFRD